MAASRVERNLHQVEDAIARVAETMQKIARDEREMAQFLLYERGFVIVWTPWSGRVKVESLAAWDALMRGHKEVTDVTPCPHVPEPPRRGHR